MSSRGIKTLGNCIIIFLFLLLGFDMKIHAQDCLFRVQITDSLSGDPLDYSNVSFKKPDQAGWEILASDREGRVEFELKQTQEITLNIAYLGYKPQEIAVRCDGYRLNREILVKMTKSGFDLEEIIITDKFPDMVEKKDTVIYNVSEFLTGNEEKLRDLLNKLPGLHVDRNNVVTYNGEVVRAILVEYDRFFTGDPSLAVKFIPADAVDKVEVLEAHNDFRILQGLGINDELALNIHLKEDKKQFFFGEGRLGTDAGRHHLGHNNLFYYSPNFNANNIVDLNTTDQAALSRGDLLKIVGMEWNNFDPKGNRNFMDQFNQMQSMLQLGHHYRQNTPTGLQQIKYKLKNKASIDVIGLARYAKNSLASRQSLIFPESETVLQTTEGNGNNRNQNYFLQFDIRSNPSSKAVVNYLFQYHNAPTYERRSNTTKIGSEETTHLAWLDHNSSSMTHEGRWIQQWQKKIKTILIYRLNTGKNRQTDHHRLNGVLIPDLYNTDGDKVQVRHDDHMNHSSHYGLLRMNYQFDERSSLHVFSRFNSSTPEVNSELHAGKRGDFSAPLLRSIDTFYTNFSFSERNLINGIRYQLKKGKLEVETGLEHQYISLSRNEKEDFNQSSTIAPHLDVSYNFLGFAQLGLKYQFDYSVPGFSHYSPTISFNEYNRFSSTSGFLVPLERHSSTLTLRRTLSKNAGTIFFTLRNTHTENPVNASYDFSNRAFFTNYFQSEESRKDWTLRMNFSRFRINRRLVYTLTANLSEYYNLVGNEELPFSQWSVSGRVNFSRTWDDIELGAYLNSSVQNIPLNTGKEQLAWSGDLVINFDWFFSEKWALHLEPGITYLKSNQLDQLTTPFHLGVEYKILDNRMKFRLDGRNLTNSKYRGTTHVSPSLTTISNHRIFPRYLLFSATYVY